MRIPKDELFLMCSFCVQLALLIFVLSMVGCGGGSEGTGVANTLQGTVSFAQSAPIQGAVISVSETGQTTVTDSNGRFSLETPLEVQTVTLEVSADDVDGDVVIDDLPSEPSTVTVNINVDPETKRVDATQVNAKAAIVGVCDYAFESTKHIRQIRGLADGTLCIAKVTLRANDRALRGVQVAVRHRPCSDAADWQVLATALTGADVHRGIAQVSFPFFNGPEYCEYQVVAPYADGRYESVFFAIETLQKQVLDDASR